MILVSTRFPEEIPSFKTSRRAAVADMSTGRLSEDHSSLALSIRYRRFARLGLEPQNEPKRTGHLRRVLLANCGGCLGSGAYGRCRTYSKSGSGTPAIINECKTRCNEGTFLTAAGDRMVPRKILQRTANLLRTRCVYRRDGPARRASSFSMPTPTDAHPNARWGQGNRWNCGGPCQTECWAPLAPHAVVRNGRQGVDFDPPPPIAHPKAALRSFLRRRPTELVL